MNYGLLFLACLAALAGLIVVWWLRERFKDRRAARLNDYLHMAMIAACFAVMAADLVRRYRR